MSVQVAFASSNMDGSYKTYNNTRVSPSNNDGQINSKIRTIDYVISFVSTV